MALVTVEVNEPRTLIEIGTSGPQGATGPQGPAGAPGSSLDNLSDVAITAAARHQQLVRGGTEWVNQTGFEFRVETRGAAPGASAAVNTTAIQDTINDAVSAGGGKVLIGPGVFNHNGGLSVATARVILEGAGPEITVLNNASVTSTSLTFTMTGFTGSAFRNCGVRELTICAGGQGNIAANATTGTGVLAIGGNEAFLMENVTIRNHTIGLELRDCWNPTVTKFDIWYCKTYGILVTETDAGNGSGALITHGRISNNGATGSIDAGGAGIYYDKGGALYVAHIDIMTMPHGVIIKPRANFWTTYSFWDSVLCDSSTFHGWLIDATNAGSSSTSHQFTNCWAGHNTVNGLVIKGTATNPDSVVWNGGRVRENGEQGVVIEGGRNVRLNGLEIAANSRLAPGAAQGVLVKAGVSEWSIQQCRIGNYASSVSPGQQYGIYIEAGASDNYQIIGNDLRGNVTGPINNGATGTNRRIVGNLPTSVADA